MTTYHHKRKINFILLQLSVSSGLHPLLCDGSRHSCVLYVKGNLCWAKTIQSSDLYDFRLRSDNKTLPPANCNLAIPNSYRNLRRQLPCLLIQKLVTGIGISSQNEHFIARVDLACFGLFTFSYVCTSFETHFSSGCWTSE